MLDRADPRRATSSAMSGKMDGRQALAAIVLWNSGHFDTFDIGKLLDVGEDAVCRTLHAARHLAGGGLMAAKKSEIDIDAINHDARHLALHAANHPGVDREIFSIDRHRECGLAIVWASPDCKHFSKAGGGQS